MLESASHRSPPVLCLYLDGRCRQGQNAWRKDESLSASFHPAIQARFRLRRFPFCKSMLLVVNLIKMKACKSTTPRKADGNKCDDFVQHPAHLLCVCLWLFSITGAATIPSLIYLQHCYLPLLLIICLLILMNSITSFQRKLLWGWLRLPEVSTNCEY